MYRIFKISALAVILIMTVYGPLHAGEALKEATLYKNPQCGCCEGYAKYLRRNGFSVKVVPTHDLPLMKKMSGVPSALEGCHTMHVDGYVIEGHVPLDTLTKLLSERPRIKGISLPGMPNGSPGMSGRKSAPFEIYEIKFGGPKVYAVE